MTLRSIHLKTHCQTVLEKLGLYYRIKESIVYGVYWRTVDKQLVSDQYSELEFYRQLLEGFHPGDLVFDVGANRGVKTSTFLRLGARVVAIDPDRVNQAILEQRFRRLRFRPKAVSVIRAAVSDRVGYAMMWVDEPGSAMNTLSHKWAETLKTTARFGRRLRFDDCEEVATTTLAALVRLHGQPIFIKIDVEGAEQEVLQGLNQAVPFLSFEINLPEFTLEGKNCVDVLMNLDPEGTFNYSADCWRGLALRHWMPAADFHEELVRCKETSIEVFWRSDRALRQFRHTAAQP